MSGSERQESLECRVPNAERLCTADATSWLHDFPIPGRVNYPLLWDRNGHEKPAYDAGVEVLRKHAGR